MEAVQPERKKRNLVIPLIIVLLLVILVLLFIFSPLKELVFPSAAEPALTLSVVESIGPDAATGLYRVMVEAKAEGKPEPQVTFNRNDGAGEVEANRTLLLLEGGETFLLKALAANPHGIVEAELELTAGIMLGASSGRVGPAGSGGSGAPAPGTGGDDDEFEDEERDPGDDSSVGGAPAPGPAESASSAEAPAADEGETDRTEPLPAPPPAEPAPPPRPDDPAPAEESADPEEGVESGPIGAPDSSEPDAPESGGSSSLAPHAPGSGSVHTPLPSIITLRPIREESGFITRDHSVYLSAYIYAGDDPYNRICRGFISFDISDFAGATIQRATLRLANPIIRGNPAIFHRTRQGLEIVDMEWHSDRLQKADYHRAGVRIATYQNYDITLDSFAGASLPMLADQLQRRIDSGNDRFRLRLQWVNETSNNDNAEDGVRYGSPLRDIMLTVYYTR